MLNWSIRLSQWRSVLTQQANGASWHLRVAYYVRSAFKMARALASGPVPAEVWRERIHTGCMRCPILNRETLTCRRELPDGRVLGCSCYVPFLALTAAPYPRGCWARQVDTSDQEGWPAYVFPSRWAKVRAVWRFLFPCKPIQKS